jgi:hypothetical protein
MQGGDQDGELCKLRRQGLLESGQLELSVGTVSWNCQLGHGGRQGAAGGARGFAYCTTSVCASLMRHGEVPLAVNETCTKLAGTAPRRPASAKSVSLLGMNAKEEALLFY